MNVGIASKTYDLDGAFLLPINPMESDLMKADRRVQRTATLDGGIAIVDSGYSHGDRTVTIVTTFDIINEAIVANLWTFFKQYSEMIISLPDDGIYDAVMQAFNNEFGKISMKILLHSALFS